MALTPLHQGCAARRPAVCRCDEPRQDRALGLSGWRYYAEELAHGREDYYAASAEHPGRFVGRGAEALGLSGAEASALALERLLGHGTDPRDGSALGRGFSPKDEKVVAGFGATFSPPKSVSVLWACGSSAIAADVLAAHDAAVSEALGFLGDHAAFTRRGHGGVYQVDTDGLLAASFTHRTSRAADPQLHTHVFLSPLPLSWVDLLARAGRRVADRRLELVLQEGVRSTPALRR